MANQPKKYKKFVATAATATLVASAIVPVASANTSFSDVKASSEFAPFIADLVDQKILNGYGDGTFKPNGTLNRGNAAQIVGRYLVANGFEYPADAETNPRFKDISASQKELLQATALLVDLGVINKGEKYNPTGTLTRSQMAKIIVEAYGKILKTDLTELVADYETDFSDVESASTAKYIKVLEKYGIATKGEKFNPTKAITRAQIAKFLSLTIASDKLKEDAKEAGKEPVKEIPTAEEIAAAEKAVEGAVAALPKAEEITKENAADAKAKADAVTAAVAAAQKLVEASELSAEDKAKAEAALKAATEAAKAVADKVAEVTAPVQEVKITSVSAINANTVEVKFNSAVPATTDFSNFDINGGLNVTNVELSSDRKTATVTVNPELVRNQEYTITLFGLKDSNDNEIAETSGKFTWEVAEGVVVALEATTLEQGQTVGLSVKDAAGKNVKDASVQVTSLNTNLVDVNATTTPSLVELTAQKLAGTTDVLVVTTLPDGSVLNNTFKVTVKEAVTTVSNAGYSFIDATAATFDPAKFANTVAFKNFATKTTSLVEGTDPKQLVAFAETNGNSDKTHLDFTDAKVTTSNAIVATAVIDPANSTDILVTPLKAGTATINVTLKDGTRKSFPITVTAAPTLTDLTVSATTVKLSDENRTEASAPSNTTGQEGVDAVVIDVETLDQYKTLIGTGAGKVVVSSNTDGIALYDTNDVTDGAATELVTGANTLDLSAGTDSFTIQAKAGKPVSNAKVTVSYFKNATDTKATITKTITVNVVDIKNDALTADIDVVAGNEIDANAANIRAAVNQIDFSTEVYALDSKGNRIENLSGTAATTTATLDAKNTEAAKYVDASSAVVSFVDVADSLTYLRAASTVNVSVEVVETAGTKVTKIIPVTYKNSAIVPNKVTVATSPVVIKLPAAGAVSFEEIIFGKLDATQLIADDASAFDLDDTLTGNFVAPLKTAKNAGYAFNKSIITVTGTDNKALATGAALYGTDDSVTDGNSWNNAIVKALAQAGLQFVAEDFEVEFAIANLSGDVTPSGNTLTDTVTLASGETSTFTLVISGVYTTGSVAAIEGSTPTAEQKAKHNLLAAPVQLNVSVSAQ